MLNECCAQTATNRWLRTAATSNKKKIKEKKIMNYLNQTNLQPCLFTYWRPFFFVVDCPIFFGPFEDKWWLKWRRRSFVPFTEWREDCCCVRVAKSWEYLRTTNWSTVDVASFSLSIFFVLFCFVLKTINVINHKSLQLMNCDRKCQWIFAMLRVHETSTTDCCWPGFRLSHTAPNIADKQIKYK